MIDLLTTILDYFFYFLIAFAIVYWLFFTNSKSKLGDIKDVAQTFRDVADDVDNAVARVEESEKMKKENKSNKTKDNSHSKKREK